MTVIKLAGVSKTYAGSAGPPALDDVSLSISAGEFVAITGTSGSGKSTLLNLIALLDRPTGGQVLIDGEPAPTRESSRARARSRTFGFVFQAFHLLDGRSAVQNAALGLMYRAVPLRRRALRAQQALDVVGMGDKKTRSVGTFSGGERQRVAIARAVVAHAPVVVADEPTGNLDSANTQHVCALLQELHRQGRTVILVTHDPAVADLANRRIHMRDGRIESDTARSLTPTPEDEALHPDEAGAADSRFSKVRLVDVVRDAWGTITSRRGRSAALAAAVALGVGMGVVTVGLAQTTSAQVSDAFDAVANRQVKVQSTSTTPGEAAEMAGPEARARLEGLAGVEHVGMTITDQSMTAQRTATSALHDASALYVSPDTPAATGMRIRWLDSTRPPGDQVRDGDVIVGPKLAGALDMGPLVGEPSLWLDGAPHRVTGVIESAGRAADAAGNVVLPLAQAPPRGQGNYTTAYLRVSAGAAQQVARQAPIAMSPTRAETLTVEAPPDPRTLRNQVEDQLGAILVVLTIVVGTASFIALANAMVMGVIQRSGELGLRRAMGARRVHVCALIVAESMILGVIGAVVGLGLGVAALLATTVANRWQPILDPATIPLAAAIGVAIGALSGLVASTRALRIAPSDALRS